MVFGKRRFDLPLAIECTSRRFSTGFFLVYASFMEAAEAIGKRFSHTFLIERFGLVPIYYGTNFRFENVLLLCTYLVYFCKLMIAGLCKVY